MSYSGDAAEQVVRMSLETGEVAIKLAGAGAKEIAVMLYAILRDQTKTRGKTRLETMLRSGKELKVFAVKDGELQKFCQEAKKYGVLYCVLKDRDATDGITDIMVRAEDASKINRIFERFQLSTVDMASIRQEIERSREDRAEGDTPTPEGDAPEEAAQENEAPPESTEREKDAFLDALFGPAKAQDEPQRENPTEAGTASPPSQSGPSSERQQPIAGGNDLKEIYHLRWAIEVSFRALKYNIGLVNFHSRKPEFCEQEIYSSLIMSNFCNRIARAVVVQQSKKNKPQIAITSWTRRGKNLGHGWSRRIYP